MSRAGRAPERSTRVAIAVGDAAVERPLVRALESAGMTVAARCLDATSLLEADLRQVDAVLLSRRLHHMSADVLVALRGQLVPAVLLVDGPVDAERFGRLAHLVPMGAPPDLAVTAVREAMEHGLLYDAMGDTDADGGASGSVGEAKPVPGAVVAVTSGKGAPGKTTLAIALAAELARGGADVALVDADLRGGNVAPCLDLDPGRGLVALRRDAVTAGAVDGELQGAPGFRVLAGLERPDLAAALPSERVAGAVAALRDRSTHVVVDAGSLAVDASQATQLHLLRAAQWVLLATGADLVSAWNTRIATRALQERLDAKQTRLAALVNRREGAEHYGDVEVERALGIPVLAAVREDRAGARRALAAQRPLTATSRGVARDLRPVVALLAAQARAGRPASRRLHLPALSLPWRTGATR